MVGSKSNTKNSVWLFCWFSYQNVTNAYNNVLQQKRYEMKCHHYLNFFDQISFDTPKLIFLTDREIYFSMLCRNFDTYKIIIKLNCYENCQLTRFTLFLITFCKLADHPPSPLSTLYIICVIHFYNNFTRISLLYGNMLNYAEARM